MALYKKACLQCGVLIATDVHACPKCDTPDPFVLRCPACLNEIDEGRLLCSCCGRNRINNYSNCPNCGNDIFVYEKCQKCGADSLIKCNNKRCGAIQFFENDICTACGQKLKK